MNGTRAIPSRATRPASAVGCLEVFRGWGTFVREALANPREVGALIPSSRELARRMAQWVDPTGLGPVVELGAGTGVVTEALLEHGVSPRRLIALERSESLAGLLRTRFPDIQVVCGDAADLRLLVPRASGGGSGAPAQVVSSLPLRSLRPDKVDAIVREIAGLLLRSGGRWIQYTYALRRREVPVGFIRRESSLVWKNLPPARIDVFAPLSRG